MGFDWSDSTAKSLMGKGLLPALILPCLPWTVRLWFTFSRPLPRSVRGHEVRNRSQRDKCRPVFLTLSCLALCKPLPLILSLLISLSLSTQFLTCPPSPLLSPQIDLGMLVQPDVGRGACGERWPFFSPSSPSLSPTEAREESPAGDTINKFYLRS